MSKFSNILTMILVVLIVAILGVVGYFAYDTLNAKKIDNNAQSALDEFYYAMWIGIKLIIVCNITIIYSNTTTIIRNSRNNKAIVHATKVF